MSVATLKKSDLDRGGDANSGNKPAATVHLNYLDGIRGLLALFVMLYHSQLTLSVRMGRPEVSGIPGLFYNLLDNGHFAVAVFIVLSGYVLMIPVARSSNGRLKGSVGDFLMRRARRILPPYYAALFMFSGLTFACQLLHLPLPVKNISLGNFTSHLFLVHNIPQEYRTSIDGVMWSLATEWQIYFIFALLLLPIYRYFGITGAVATAIIGSFVPVLVFHNINYANFCPWYVGLFALGMLAAWMSFEEKARVRTQALPWGKIALVLAGGFLAIRYIPAVDQLIQDDATLALVPMDLLVGVMAMAALMHCTRSLQAKELSGKERRGSAVLRFFQSKWLLWLGMFSYSLYLIHQPIIGFLIVFVMKMHLPPVAVCALTLLALPLVVAGAYGFFLLFEKPWLGRGKPRPVATGAEGQSGAAIVAAGQ